MSEQKVRELIAKWHELGDGFGNHRWKSAKHECANELEAALAASEPPPQAGEFDARAWLLAGGGGHEGGADGLRALSVSGEGLVEFLEAFKEDLLAAGRAVNRRVTKADIENALDCSWTGARYDYEQVAKQLNLRLAASALLRSQSARDPSLPWLCSSCGQRNSAWASECGRCEKTVRPTTKAK